VGATGAGFWNKYANPWTPFAGVVVLVLTPNAEGLDATGLDATGFVLALLEIRLEMTLGFLMPGVLATTLGADEGGSASRFALKGNIDE
jgi:hypothetical protein